MYIGQIVFFSVLGVAFPFLPNQWRSWSLLTGCVIAIYWLQPTLNIRWLDYSLPTATILISIFCWLSLQSRTVNQPFFKSLKREDWTTLGIIFTVILVLTLSREVNLSLAIISRPPPIVSVLPGICVIVAVVYVVQRMVPQNQILWLTILLVIALLFISKNDTTATILSRFLRGQSGQDMALASLSDFQWLGFSYVAFRLVHTLRDYQSGLLPELTLREYVTYLLFLPTITAGPIDRAEHFTQNYQALPQLLKMDGDRIWRGLNRIAIGLFKKFVVADSLAYFSLTAVLASQASSTIALWGMLYAFAFRLYFDFSGYSDIAIGLGILFGIALPENFTAPYLKNTITLFWQSWHITLSNWVRFYVYSPLSRSLLKRTPKLSTNFVILTCTVVTMVVIGLWHGITWNFLIWGLWHGIGLFIHKLWSDRTRKWQKKLQQRVVSKTIWRLSGVILTFHFVLLGWVWFALPDTNAALTVFSLLFGLTK